MYITAQQRENIRAVLWNRTRYKETFDELYDHVLSAIENYDQEDLLPHEIASAIINEQFGGWDKLKDWESERQKMLSKALWRNLWMQIKSYFKLPLLIFTLITAVLAYNLAINITKGNLFFIILFAATGPAVLSTKLLPFNWWSRRFKKSMKENAVRHIGTLGVSVINCILILPLNFAKDNYSVFAQLHASGLAVVMVFYVIYVLSALKVLKLELKKQALA